MGMCAPKSPTTGLSGRPLTKGRSLQGETLPSIVLTTPKPSKFGAEFRRTCSCIISTVAVVSGHQCQ